VVRRVYLNIGSESTDLLTKKASAEAMRVVPFAPTTTKLTDEELDELLNSDSETDD
jgi:hypothetical protein